jgi:hypothetical protein
MRTLLLALACTSILGCAADPIDNTVDGAISTAENCLDGIDNDTDGFIDCSDQDCAQAGACRGFGDTGTADTGTTDTGVQDTGSADTNSTDTAPTDTGTTSAGAYVAIVSRAVENPSNHGNTPGPDLDAVAVMSGGVSSFAASVAKVIQGRSSDPEGNVNDVSSAITGPNDAMTDNTGGTCDLAEGQGFFALGYGDSPQGIIVLAMPNAIQTGDSVVVYEIGPGFCSNVNVVREDSFDVYVGPSNVNVAAITDLSSLVGQGFLLAGTQSAQNGGIFEFAAP